MLVNRLHFSHKGIIFIGLFGIQRNAVFGCLVHKAGHCCGLLRTSSFEGFNLFLNIHR
ncbi:hypothetical protein D3C77_673170 [compost metagenome]